MARFRRDEQRKEQERLYKAPVVRPELLRISFYPMLRPKSATGAILTRSPDRECYRGSPDPLARPGVRELAAFCA